MPKVISNERYEKMVEAEETIKQLMRKITGYSKLKKEHEDLKRDYGQLDKRYREFVDKTKSKTKDKRKKWLYGYPDESY